MHIEFVEDKNLLTVRTEELVQTMELVYFFKESGTGFFKGGNIFKMEFFAEDMTSDVGKIVIKFPDDNGQLVVFDFF